MVPPVMNARLQRDHGYVSVYALAFSPDGAYLAIAGDSLPPHGSSHATNHNITLLVAVTAQEVSRLGTHMWQLLPGEWRTRMSGATGGVVYAVDISPDGHMLVSAGDDELRFWDIRPI